MADPWCYFVGREYAHHHFSKAASSNGCNSGSWHHYRFAPEDELLYFPSCNITQTDQTIISYDYGKVWGWFSLPIPIERREADDGVVFLWEKFPLCTLGSRSLFYLSLQLLPLPLSPVSVAISGSGFLHWHSKTLWSSFLVVHRGVCSSGLTIMDFPAKMEEINPIKFSWYILQEK